MSKFAKKAAPYVFTGLSFFALKGDATIEKKGGVLKGKETPDKIIPYTDTIQKQIGDTLNLTPNLEGGDPPDLEISDTTRVRIDIAKALLEKVTQSTGEEQDLHEKNLQKHLIALQQDFHVPEDIPLGWSGKKDYLEVWKFIAEAYYALKNNIFAFSAYENVQKLGSEDKELLISIYRNMGRCAESSNEDKIAAQYYADGFAYSKEVGDDLSAAIYASDLGYMYRKKLDEGLEKAKDWYQKSLEHAQKSKDAFRIAYAKQMIAVIYTNELDEFSIKVQEEKLKDSPDELQKWREQYAQKLLKIRILVSEALRAYREMNDEIGIADLERHTKWLDYQESKLNEHQRPLEKSVLMAWKNEVESTVHDYEALGNTQDDAVYQALKENWMTLSRVYDDLKDLKGAMNAAQKALEYSEKLGNEGVEAKLEMIRLTVPLKTWLLINDLLDGVGSEEKEKLMKELADSEAELKVTEAEMEAEVAEAKRKATEKVNFWLKLQAIVGALGTGVIVRFWRKSVSQKRQIEQQKSILEGKNKLIQDAISAAKSLLFPKLRASLSAFENFVGVENGFVLLNAKDVLSGDFYFGKNLSKNIFVSVSADCTGHGVPGALLSVLMQSLLEDMINEIKLKKKTEAEIRRMLEENNGQFFVQAIEELTAKALAFLKGDWDMDSVPQMSAIILDGLSYKDFVKDFRAKGDHGMEMSLNILDRKSGVYFLGAGHDDYVSRKDGELERIHGSKRSISDLGLFENAPSALKEFRIEKFDLDEGEWLYSFSDGYSDQFGGKEGGKFKSRKFKNLLLEISSKNPFEQVQTLQRALKKWQGRLEQTDDILVVGISGDVFKST